MLKSKLLGALAVLALFTAFFTPLSAAAQAGVPELIRRAAENQSESLAARDRTRYEQSLKVEKYKLSSKPGEPQRLEGVQTTVVLVEPSTQPDETGEYLVNVRVIQDTDDEGKPKKKVDPNSRTLLSFPTIWDAAFFPLLPEKINHYSYDELVSGKAGERKYSFTPKVNAPPNIILATGTVTIDEKKGQVLTIKIDGLRNLASLDKRLNDMRSFTAITDYSEFEGRYRFPTYSKGVVDSDISRFKGNFRYTFEEGKYIQVLTVAK